MNHKQIKELSDQARCGSDVPAQITIDLFDHALKLKNDQDVYDLQYHIKVVLAIMDKRLENDILLLNKLNAILCR